MRTLLRLFVVTCSLATCVRAAPAAPAVTSPAAGRPNILVVVVDDAGYGDFGCHGHPFLQTPNIDRLHAQSVRLTDFHVSPMCTPTRGQLLTGMDAVRNGATSVTGGRSFVRPGVRTMPEILAAAGYRTGMFGKWHLGDNYPHRPTDRGFRDAVWVKGWGFTSAPEFANALTDGRCYRGADEARFKGYVTDFCFDEAMSWMRERRAKQEPFFCYLPLHAAHTPHQVPERYRAPYAGRANRAAGFFGMLANVDENVGRLDRFLADAGLRDDTIVVFMTDNGGTAGVPFHNAGLRGRKTEYYDGGHRVPCFVRWPGGGLRPPGDVAAPTQAQDLLPTLLDLAGAPRPPGVTFDGASLAGLLRGRGDDRRADDGLADRTFVVQYSRATLAKWECAVVSGSWRLVGGTELYDVAADRGQQTDLAGRQADVVARLRAHYERWWDGLGPAASQFVPAAVVGSAAQPRVALTSADWQDVYCDNARHIREAVGGPRGGPWNLHVEQAGEYEVAVRRWPPELDLPLAAGHGPGSRALPITSATLTVGGQTVSAKADGARAAAVVFRVSLPAGPTRLQAWFQDDRGNDLCGAFYADLVPATTRE